MEKLCVFPTECRLPTRPIILSLLAEQFGQQPDPDHCRKSNNGYCQWPQLGQIAFHGLGGGTGSAGNNDTILGRFLSNQPFMTIRALRSLKLNLGLAVGAICH